MILFKNTDGNDFTDSDFSQALSKLQLYGKTVLVYSRLFALGRITGIEAIKKIIVLLQQAVGKEGTLCFPCYTFSAYNNEIFDAKQSKCVVGVLGEVARHQENFIRTTHPVYSNVCWGKEALFLQQQKPTTCFGEDSFFERFSQLKNSYVLMLGTNFNAATLYHYYDQKYQTPGRFKKNFDATIVIEGSQQQIQFDTYVKDYEFYENKTNCLAKFDAFATQLNFVERTECGNDWMHGIEETNFHQLYKACIETAPLEYLFAQEEVWQDYYQKNNYSLYHHKIDKEQLNTISQYL